MVYLWSVLFSVLSSVLYLAINLLLWRFLYRDSPTMVSYMIRYTIISNIIDMLYPRGVADRIGEKVSSGAFIIDLIRPINFFAMSWQLELAWICSKFLLRGLPVILLFSPFLVQNAGYYNIPAVLLAVVLGHIIFLLIYSLIGFSAFILIETWPAARLMNDTVRLLAGMFIPLAILPGLLQKAAYALPFRFLYSFPLELLFGTADRSLLAGSFALLILWIGVFALLNLATYRLALKKAVIQGG